MVMVGPNDLYNLMNEWMNEAKILHIYTKI